MPDLKFNRKNQITMIVEEGIIDLFNLIYPPLPNRLNGYASLLRIGTLIAV